MRLTIKCKSGKTKQSMQAACDINNIMAKYIKTGVLPSVTQRQAIYGDFTKLGDLQGAMLLLNNARIKFRQLPADVQKFFKGDVESMLSFISDPANFDKAVELGLVNKPVVKVNDKVKVDDKAEVDKVK